MGQRVLSTNPNSDSDSAGQIGCAGRRYFDCARISHLKTYNKKKNATQRKLSDHSLEKGNSITLSTGSETRLLRVVHDVYRRWAFFVVDHAWTIVTVCTLVTIICTIKILFTPQRNEITGYTPYGARSLAELAARERFFGQSDGPPFGALILILPRHGDNLLGEEALAEIVRVDDIIRNNLTIFNHVTNRNETFADFCSDFCDLNEPIRQFYNGYRLQMSRMRENDSLYSRIELRYPISRIFGRRFSVQPNFFGVEFSGDSAVDILTNIERVHLATLIYKAERVGGWSNDEIKDYEISITRYFDDVYKSNIIKVLTVSTTYVEYEVVRAGMSMLPFLLVGFAIMAVCSSTTVFLSAAYFQQVSVHKFSLAIMACICPFMACGTALGLLFFAGVRFGSVLCVTPFLVLAIGVDDAYLMIHSWQRVSKEMRVCPTKRDNVGHQLALVLIDTGPAILISALTNIGADAVGSFTGSPEITLLCVGNMASIFVDFVYQVTFYAAFIAIIGRYEIRRESRAIYSLSIPVGASVLNIAGETSHSESGPSMASLGKIGQRVRTLELKTSNVSFRERIESRFERLISGYVRVVTHGVVAAAICALWLAFFVFALISDYYREQDIVPFYTMATVFVDSPGDFGDPARLARFEEMVRQMEAMPESWGPDSTNLFLRDFFAFESENEEQENVAQVETLAILNGTLARQQSRTDEVESSTRNNKNSTGFVAEDLVKFLEWPEYSFWRGFVHVRGNGSKTRLDSFFFTTAYHAEHLRIWAERTRLLQRWRAVVDAYPEFSATVYHDEGIFLDLIDNMPTDAWQSALATLACMAVICAAFMFNAFSVGVATAVIASIIVGTLGMLSWQDVTMDPIMMAALMISVGFSVDIPTHVSYHYYISGRELGSSVQDRLKATFASVGFPALQASASTSLCVLSLLFVKLYMARIFVRIMCSCIILCVVHSLIVLPAVFTLVDCAMNFLQSRLRLRSHVTPIDAVKNGGRTNDDIPLP